MAFKSESRRIGAHNYKVTQLDAVRGSRAALRLTKPLGAAAASYSETKSEAHALGALVSGLDEKDFEYLTNLFASTTEVSGGQYGDRAPTLDNVFAVHFAGNYGEMIGWLVFCVELNFTSFFDGAEALLGKLGSASRSKT